MRKHGGGREGGRTIKKMAADFGEGRKRREIRLAKYSKKFSVGNNTTENNENT